MYYLTILLLLCNVGSLFAYKNLAQARITLDSAHEKQWGILDMIKNITSIVTDLQNMVQNIARDLQNTIPVGMVYVQLPDTDEPHTLWPRTQWRDISEEYAGVFLRVLGGNSESFGRFQESIFPDLDIRSSEEPHPAYNQTFTVPKNMWSPNILTGSHMGQRLHALSFKWGRNVDGAVPKNMAVRVWKRVNQ